MTAIERTAYPRFKATLTQKELDTLYTPTPDERIFAQQTANDQAPQLHLLILLKAVQRLGYFPTLADIPMRIVHHIRTCLQVAPEVTLTDPLTSRYRYRSAIRTYMNTKSYRLGGEAVASLAMQQAAQTMDDPADVINAAIEELVRQHFELPAFGTLDRMAGHIRAEINHQWFALIAERLDKTDHATLDQLLKVAEGAWRTPFAQLKDPAPHASIAHMNETVARLAWLESLADVKRLLDDIPQDKISRFAAQARALEADHIADVKPPQRYTFMLCLIAQAQTQTRDNLVEMFLKQMRKVHNNAQQALETLQLRQRERAEYLISLLEQIARESKATPEDVELGRSVRHTLAQVEGGVDAVLDDCEAIIAYQNNNYLPLVWRFYKSHRAAFFRLLTHLDIRTTTQDQSLGEALHFLRRCQSMRNTYLPDTPPLDFASARWLKLITENHQGKLRYKRRQFEICTFSYLAHELRAGDMYVVGSETFADYRAQLLSWENCLSLLDEHCLAVDLAVTPTGFVQQLKRWLTQTAETVDQSFLEHGQLRFDDEGTPTLRKLNNLPAPPGANILNAHLPERLPQLSVLDVLKNVDGWVHFTRHFGPISGTDPKIKDPALRYLMTLFCYGCNLGPDQTALHSRDLVSARTLAFINYQHITTEKLDAAIHDIIDYYARFDLPYFWGTGKTAIADGTQFDLYRNNLMAEQHIRYGGYGGIAYYHISDTYIALFSHFIACGVWEAVYIIDGLLKNKSEFQPDTVHADTQGQSLPVFGLAHLLGIKLMPRIRNWKDLTLFRPTQATRYTHIDSLFSDTIDWDLLETHWQDLMQVVLSIKAGKVLPSMLLRKLGHHSRKNRLYKAFRELGRVVRTVFLSHYISDGPLRRQIIAHTCKIESFNAFCKWLLFGANGVITHRDPVEQEKRIKYNQLVANALMLQNIIDMTPLLKQMAHEGYTVTPETLSTLSPYPHDHIRRFGDYVLNLDELPEPLTPDRFVLALL